MLDALSRHGQVPEQIVLSSSRAVYGEGAWRRFDGHGFYSAQRDRDLLVRGEWDVPAAEAFAVCCRRDRAATDEHLRSHQARTGTLLGKLSLGIWSLAHDLLPTKCLWPRAITDKSLHGRPEFVARLAQKGESIPYLRAG
jgi:hypothetical protein